MARVLLSEKCWRSAAACGLWALSVGAAIGAERLAPGNHVRTVRVGEIDRTCRVHVPPNYDAAAPTPVVLCFHGAVTNGPVTSLYTKLDDKSDRAGFIVAYPNGTGSNRWLLTWNSGGLPSRLPEAQRDDVRFTQLLLDDLERVVNVDKKRVFATGLSNGGMMSYRLAVELPDRIAAIASVAGCLALPNPQPTRRVPILEIHGTKDRLVPWNGLRLGPFRLRSVEETIDFWVRHNGCAPQKVVEPLADQAADGVSSTRTTYAAGDDGADVVLISVDGGGHTWPGSPYDLKFLGPTTKDFEANDVIWEFFEKHPRK